MDVLFTPRRPHKSPAHTVKDRILAQRFRFRVPNISSERAAYYTTIFVSVNTFLKTFSKKFCRYFALRISPAAAPIEGGRIIHPISDSSTPAKRLFCFALPTTRKVALCRTAAFPAARRRAANPTTNSRFVKPPDAAFLQALSSAIRAMRQPNEPVRTNACRSAADARRPRRACVRDPRPQRRLYAPPSR